MNTFQRLASPFRLIAIALVLSLPIFAHAFDHSYKNWTSLLQTHVKWNAEKTASTVDYKGFQEDRGRLKAVLTELSMVTQAEFDAMNREQQMAFLINAYNAYTIELIMTKYPDLKSIKDLGNFVFSPWKKEFFNLLGKPRHLDWIEHDMLRPKYQEPRIHAAVNCASIGCPGLLDEAYKANVLVDQLDTGMYRFLSDNTRNRLKDGKLEVSPIFKWFREDFEQNHQGFGSLGTVFARYRHAFTKDPTELRMLQTRQYEVDFLDYDWSLNDAK